MITLVLIVLSCTIVGTGVSLLVQRAGWLPPVVTGRPAPSDRGSSRSRRGRPIAVAALAIMSGWIVFWMVLLFVGLGLISRAR